MCIETSYSHLRQNYLNNYFQAKVGKKLPQQFPEPLSVSKLDVGHFVFSNTAKTLCKPELPQTFSWRVKVCNLLPD